VAEVLFGQRVCYPLTIDHLALGKRDVHRVGDPVLEIVGFELNGIGHENMKVEL